MAAPHGTIDYDRTARMTLFGLFLKGPALAAFYHNIEVHLEITNIYPGITNIAICSSSAASWFLSKLPTTRVLFPVT